MSNKKKRGATQYPPLKSANLVNFVISDSLIYKNTENIEENKLVLSLSYQDERKRISPNLEKTNKLPIFVPHWFATPLRGKQLKGNQV